MHMSLKRFEIPFFIGLVVLAGALLAFVFFPYLSSIILAITLTIIFFPVFLRLRKRMPKWEGLASFLTVILAIIIILGPISFFGYKIFQEAQDLYARVASGNLGILTEFLNNKFGQALPWLSVDFNQYIKQILATLVGGVGPIFSRLTNSTIVLLLSMFTFYYLLKDADRVRRGIIKISPLSENFTEEIISELSNMANSVIKGSLVVAIIQGFLVGVGFFIFGLSGAVLWGSVAAIAALIPLLGTSIIAVPGIIALFLSGNIAAAVGLLIWSLLLVGLIDNFLRPKLIGRKTHIHPLLVFFSVLGGLAVFGATGLLLGPLVLSFFLALVKIYPLILKEKSE